MMIADNHELRSVSGALARPPPTRLRAQRRDGGGSKFHRRFVLLLPTPCLAISQYCVSNDGIIEEYGMGYDLCHNAQAAGMRTRSRTAIWGEATMEVQEVQASTYAPYAARQTAGNQADVRAAVRPLPLKRRTESQAAAVDNEFFSKMCNFRIAKCSP